MQGTIKRLIADKHFGFIASEELGTDVFFHSSVLEGASFEELKEGQAVEFEHEDAPRGPKANSVKVAAAAATE